jgi:hypothetical protein
VKNQDSMGKTNFFLSTLPFSPRAVLPTWMHVGAPQKKIQKNELNTLFEQNFTTGSYGVGIGCVWCSRKACKIFSSIVQKKRNEKNHFSSQKLPKQQSTSFWSQGILGVMQGAYVLLFFKKKKQKHSLILACAGFYLSFSFLGHFLCFLAKVFWFCS